MNSTSNRKYVMVVVMLGFLFQLSCGRELTRRTAAKAINEKYGYPKAVTDSIRVGKCNDLFVGDNFLKSREGERWAKYQEAGLLIIENLTISYPAVVAPLRRADFNVKLTPEGGRYLIKSSGDYVDVRLCSEVLVEVTGIAYSGEKNQATVEFNSRCSDITPFGQVNGVDEAALRAHQVEAQLYDDGWRL